MLAVQACAGADLAVTYQRARLPCCEQQLGDCRAVRLAVCCPVIPDAPPLWKVVCGSCIQLLSSLHSQRVPHATDDANCFPTHLEKWQHKQLSASLQPANAEGFAPSKRKCLAAAHAARKVCPSLCVQQHQPEHVYGQHREGPCRPCKSYRLPARRLIFPSLVRVARKFQPSRLQLQKRRHGWPGKQLVLCMQPQPRGKRTGLLRDASAICLLHIAVSSHVAGITSTACRIAGLPNALLLCLPVLRRGSRQLREHPTRRRILRPIPWARYALTSGVRSCCSSVST